jgi:T5orf172 domain
MALHLNSYTIFATAVFLALLFSQRLLVVLGYVLGIGISYPHVRTRKTKTKHLDLNDHRLVFCSINDKELKCIFPKFERCGGRVTGRPDDEFNTLLRSVPHCRPHEVETQLSRMVALKFCSACQKNDYAEYFIKRYVKKWAAEIGSKLPYSVAHMSEGIEVDSPSDGSAVAQDFSSGVAPLESAEDSRNTPGACYDSAPPSASPSVAARGRCYSGRGRRVSASHPPGVQGMTSQTTPAPGREVPSTTEVTPSGQTTATGWRIVQYSVKKPESLHHRIFMSLEPEEIESAWIYVLHREDDEEYYKVGFSNDVQERLKEHNQACRGNWKLLWFGQVDHAKRVEKLIHLEAGFRGIRYIESCCKTGERKCKRQHREIIKATFAEVEACVRHWVNWMTRFKGYTESPASETPPQGQQPSNQTTLKAVWKLDSAHAAKIVNTEDEFCLMSTGESWVEPRRHGRSKSTSDISTPKRPRVDSSKRQTTQAATKFTQESDRLQVPGPSTPTRSSSVRTRSSSKKTTEIMEDVQASLEISRPQIFLEATGLPGSVLSAPRATRNNDREVMEDTDTEAREDIENVTDNNDTPMEVTYSALEDTDTELTKRIRGLSINPKPRKPDSEAVEARIETEPQEQDNTAAPAETAKNPQYCGNYHNKFSAAKQGCLTSGRDESVS